MRKIIIDTDPGIDDAIAIIAAHKIPEFEILGISTVQGNLKVERCTENALGLMQLLESKVPVYEGVGQSMSKIPDLTMRADDIHGKVGIGDVVLPSDKVFAEKMHSVDFIIECAKKYPNELEIIMLGAHTNIASAILKDPDAMKNVKTIWTMGGAHLTGNVTEYAEFNFWADSEAAKVVLNFGKFIDIYIFGLNVTHAAPMLPRDFIYYGAFGGKIGKFILDISHVYCKRYFEFTKKLDIIIHDLLTVMCAKEQSLCKYTRCHVDIITEGDRVGQSICDVDNETGKEPNAYFAVEVDAVAYRKLFVKTVFPEAYDDYEQYVAIF